MMTGAAPLPLAAQACEWYFDWTCPRCQQMGGKYAGQQRGYSSEIACESNRGRTHVTVRTTPCRSVGVCTKPVPPKPNPVPPAKTPPKTPPKTQISPPIKQTQRTLPVLDPKFFRTPPKKIRYRSVPSPLQTPLGDWKRMVKGSYADIVLDALQAGKGNLENSIKFLDDHIRRHGPFLRLENALSYVEGLNHSYIAAERIWWARGGKPASQAITVNIGAHFLLQAISGQAQASWPGTKRTSGAPLTNPVDWRVARTEALLGAIAKNPGNIDGTFSLLRAQGKRNPLDNAAANAERYLEGAIAYMHFLDDGGTP